jgi:hypothetical protein
MAGAKCEDGVAFETSLSALTDRVLLPLVREEAFVRLP